MKWDFKTNFIYYVNSGKTDGRNVIMKNTLVTETRMKNSSYLYNYVTVVQMNKRSYKDERIDFYKLKFHN